MRPLGRAGPLDANEQRPAEPAAGSWRLRWGWSQARLTTGGSVLVLAVLAVLVLSLASGGDAQAAVDDGGIEPSGQLGQPADQTPPPRPGRRSNTLGVVVLVVAVVGPAAGVTVSLVRARRRAGRGSTEAGA